MIIRIIFSRFLKTLGRQRLQAYENNCVRRLMGVKRVDRRRMDELKEEIGVQMSLTGRLVRSRLKWAGHFVRMKEKRMATKWIG